MNAGEKVLIYGLGRSGRGAARFLAREGVRAEWHDARPSAEDEALMHELGLARGDVGGTYRTVVAAPGVPIDHPDLLALAARGAEIIGEVTLAARLRPHLPLVGVTGTAGKGGTTVLIAHLLRESGLNAREGGNIDPPLLDVVDEAEVAVVELSSFQLERVPGLRLPVAVITNLGVDHLDRHRTVEAYHAAKLNITAGQEAEDVLVVPAGLKVATRAQVRPFQPDRITLADGREVLPDADLPEGLHPANAAAAVLAAEALLRRLGRPVDVERLAAGLRSARPVAGRFETVARLGNVRFIEDSIATRTLAVEAALTRAPAPIAWLVGGRDKGADLAPLREAARGRVKRVIAFGEDGEKLARDLGLPFETVTGADGDGVMQAAARAGLEALGGPEGTGTVLLAPIGTSFDLFQDYKARGASFTRAARALATEEVGA
ncbi:UDP-N-acetylmuramoyl-L-alanine--D-glutamate ligase [Deinococcus metallilatus]|uniref:UDP-N-acetylmuramoylalanine--D-glutamate ligase n=1 Tax=Deinococcus metallilatus TaxID=1211322 RepID=A0AAJ5F3R1_9DEIO|nr:UDP-N-acetylmuramoyl-L-alanine--D-glutamate ligase [Deinococcus metallilatus]MBB5295913.1 UDP-N-acetylmuramoylalanine--D-glutamate ligase [Deinococcus metallilatus]QBY08253.1 UDP-N-acetylmuramoyl-L-alanine--D-glutamate ligase [Deinococcus metallilatus]RXJ11984.1 UDP-N-acetylmuramoyl-L-alanine--D-glutamate ligase [Deinococcus metallilatus]TLK25784.1 UDP-N-acetylmuramoyl-L-alanine--D-glutamate ligase [Deinococcus metallilatus]GMA14553.1 UDP-N-acetylmuramoylalanine--D-glutamate ligase [Deinoco